MSTGPSLWVVAGEASGDAHLAHVVRELHARWPGLQVEGLGGPELARAGVKVHADLASDAIMGLWPVIKAIPKIRGWFALCERAWQLKRPDALLLCDYPGFNLRLAARAKAAGIPVIQYVGPQLWAWAPWRIEKVRRAVDLVLVILPFEEAIYRDAAIPVRFTGHPLMDHFRRASIDAARVEALRGLGAPLIGLFPGSRRHVIERLAPVFFRAAQHLCTRPGFERAHFVLALAQESFRPLIEAVRLPDLPLTIQTGSAYEVMRAADVAMATSGTTTLELAASGTPFVLGYRVSRFFYALGRRLISVPHIGLVNLVANRGIVPEHVGYADFHQALAADVARLIEDPKARAAQLTGHAEVRGRLATHDDAYAEAAEAVTQFLRQRMPVVR